MGSPLKAAYRAHTHAQAPNFPLVTHHQTHSDLEEIHSLAVSPSPHTGAQK